MRVVVTGASGFVGGHLVPHLRAQGIEVLTTARVSSGSGSSTVLGLDDLTSPEFRAALERSDAVVHLAGAAHRQSHVDSHDSVNHLLTERLALAASCSGVARFVFLSSATVYGNTPRTTVNGNSPVHPIGSYAESKVAAEHALTAIDQLTQMRCVSLRPPVIYGRGVKGNLAMLANHVRRGLPIPVARSNIERSFLSVTSLCAAIFASLTSPQPLSGPFALADDQPLEIRDLLYGMGRPAGRSPRIVPLPHRALLAADALAGLLLRRPPLQPLITPFVIDSSDFRSRTDWTSPFSIEDLEASFTSDPSPTIG
ncbi:MAG: NAD-dependent epimerase/dehydratase family protein [Acidimicrobiales bacterium]